MASCVGVPPHLVAWACAPFRLLTHRCREGRLLNSGRSPALASMGLLVFRLLFLLLLSRRLRLLLRLLFSRHGLRERCACLLPLRGRGRSLPRMLGSASRSMP